MISLIVFRPVYFLFEKMVSSIPHYPGTMKLLVNMCKEVVEIGNKALASWSIPKLSGSHQYKEKNRVKVSRRV